MCNAAPDNVLGVWLLPVTFAVLLATGAFCAAEPSDPSVLIRKIYVPADNTTSWPTEGKSYLPIDANRLAELRAAADRIDSPFESARVSVCKLHATTRDDGQLAGRGAMRVEVASDAQNWLELPVGGTALNQLKWRSTGELVGLGLWGGHYGLENPLVGFKTAATDWIDFEYKHTPTKQQGELRTYRLSLPKALAYQLILDLPQSQTPAALSDSDVVIVEFNRETEEHRKSVRQSFPWAPEVPATHNRWLLFCDQGDELAWRVESAQAESANRARLPALTERIRYMQTESGLEIAQLLSLAGNESLPKELTLAAPRNLVVTSLAWDSQPVMASRDAIDGSYRIQLPDTATQPSDASAENPRPIHQLDVRAWYPWEPDREARLPQVRIRETFWSGGFIQLQLAPSLTVASLEAENAVQRTPAGDEPVDAQVFDKLSPSGHLLLKTIRRPSVESVRIGRVVELSIRDSKATLLNVFQPSAGASAQSLVADMVGDWRVQNVTTNSPYNINDWYVADGSKDQRQLHVRVSHDARRRDTMNSPIVNTPPEAIELTVEATQAASAGDAWVPLSETVVLHWRDATVKEDLLTIECDDGKEVELNPQPRALVEDVVMPKLGPLLPATTSGDVFDLRTVASDTRIHLRTARASYSAAVFTRVIDQGDRWSQKCEIACVPQRGLVTQVDIRVSGALADKVRWKRAGEDAWRLATRIVEKSGEVDSFDDTNNPGTLWALVLPRPQAAEFTLIVDVPDSSGNVCNLSPPVVLNAKQQTSRCLVQSENPRRIKIDSAGWTLASELAGTSNNNRFRLGSPVHSVWASNASAVDRKLRVERRRQSQFVPRAWISASRLDSTYTPNAPVRHSFTFDVVCESETQLQCELPENAEEISWRLLGSRAEAETPDRSSISRRSDANFFTIPLMPRESANDEDAIVETYRIDYIVRSNAIEHGRQLEANWPQLSFPATETLWRIHYPADYGIVEEISNQAAPNWRERLFGSLASYRLGNDRGLNSAGSLESSEFRRAGLQPLALTAVHLPTRRAQHALLFLVGLATAQLTWRRPVWLISILGLCLIAALLLPAGWSTWVTAMWGGALLATALGGLQAAARHTPSLSKLPTTNATTTSSLLFVASLNLVASPVQAEQSSPVIENMLIPIDADGDVIGDQRFVTPELLAELLRRERLATATHQWRIESSHVVATFAPDSEGIELATRDWEWSFDLTTMRDGVEVRLPIHQADATWRRQIVLDGLPISLRWNDTASECSFVAKNAGKYRARIAFRPRVQSVADRQEIRVRLLPVPDAEIGFDTTANLTGLEINGRFVKTADDAKLPMQLGTQPNLLLRWAANQREPLIDDWQVTQYEWLTIDRESMLIDCVLRISGQPDQAPPIELVSSVPGFRVNASADAVGDKAVRNRWKLSASREDTEDGQSEFVVRCQLRFDRPHTWGRIRIPKLQIAGIEASGTLIAVSHDRDMLVTSERAVEDISSSQLEALSSNWPDRRRYLPDLIVREAPQGPPSFLGVKPDVGNLPPEETLSVGCFKQELEVEYRGDFPGGSTKRYQHVFSVSPDLEIASIKMSRQGLQTSVRFTRPQPDELVVFFANPTLASFGLTIRGRIALTNGATPSLPKLTSSLRQADPQRLDLYCDPRLSAMLVSGIQPGQADDTQPSLVLSPSEVPQGWQAYAIGSYELSPRQASRQQLRISNNSPQYDASVLSTLIPSGGDWVAEVGVLLKVEKETLAEVVLNWPSNLAGQPDISPPAYVSFDATNTSGDRRLRIRFTQPVLAGQSQRLTIRSAIRPNAAGLLTYPVVSAVGSKNTERYFGLLASEDGEWNLNNVSPAVAPADVEGLLANWPDAKLLAANRSQTPTIQWNPNARTQPSKRIPLITVEGEVFQDGIVLRKRLTLPALGNDVCTLNVPSGQQLLVLRIDGQTAIANETVENAYTMRIPEPTLPHVVEVVTKINSQLGVGESVKLGLVSLTDEQSRLEVEQAIWNLSAADKSLRIESETGEVLTLLDQAVLALNQSLQAATVQTDGGKEYPRWAATWAGELSRRETVLRAALETSKPKSEEIVTQPDLEAEYAGLLARSATEITRLQTIAGALPDPLAANPASISLPTMKAVGRPRYTFAQASGDALEIHCRDERPSDAPQRTALAFAALIATTTAVAATKREQWPNLSQEWLFPFAIVLGLSWWLLLWPRILGLLIAAVAAAAWLRYSRAVNTTERQKI